MGLDARDAGWRESARVIFTWRLCRDAIAVGRAHAQFRFASGWKVNAELPGPPGSASATRFDLALVQIGGDHQDEFFSFAEKELLSALKEL